MFPVDVFQITLAKLTTILGRHDIRFHLTGGLTGTAYGEPRMTQDIDIVIDPVVSRQNLEPLVKSVMQSDFLFNEEAMRRAVLMGDLFQLLDERECLKLDIYPREMIPGELQRSEWLEIFVGEEIPVVSRVDAAVSKLIWISKGSHKSRRDLRAIARNCTQVQRDAIAQHAMAFELSELLREVLAETDEIS
ncbi:MAG: nucleotidyl transferase AbiEii/AbiGii toxin family protein [Rubripirellula sp.]